jgi:ribosomal protein S12 methylthiotransferase
VEKPGKLYREDALSVSWPEGMQAPLSAYIKIADGCDNACRFCAIPQIRGRMRSRGQDAIVSEIDNLVHNGTREVILVAQDTTSWGIDLPEKPDLADLLQAINAVEGTFWIRLMYAHPAFLTDRQIDTIAHCGKLIPYIDMPLQHTSDRMLDIMNRHITTAQTQDRIDRLRAARPGMAIRTTFILGHPGETDDDFEQLLEFASENAFERMGVFPYSAEEGTPSAQMDEVVPESVTRERIERLTDAYDRWSAEFSIDQVGSTIPCLLEHLDGDSWEGRTVYDSPEIDGRVLAGGPIDSPGLYNVRVTDALGIDLKGEVPVGEAPSDRTSAVTMPEERQ